MSLVCVKRSGGRHGRARSSRNELATLRERAAQRPRFDPLRRGTGQGRGGMRYLRNISSRLGEIGFFLDNASGLWVRPKVMDGQERVLDLETLEEVDDEWWRSPLD